MSESENYQTVDDDGLYTPEIAPHSIEKIRLHNYYVSLFATSMKDRWPQRAYIGLYSGAGRARIRDSSSIVETTALGAMRTAHPFTKYIFVDNDPRCVEALTRRSDGLQSGLDVSVIGCDVKDGFPEIAKVMPSYGPGRGLLSFCFVDPYAADLDFSIIKLLANQYRMDFLVLLMLGVDVRQNFRKYYEDREDTRIGRLIDDLEWRKEWDDRGLGRKDLIRFLLEKFDAAMVRLGYQAADPDESHPVRIRGKGVFLYSLVLYSKNELGRRFWQTSRKGTTGQLALDLT